MDLHHIADANLVLLGNNSYVGRGIVVGLSEDEKHLVQVYWITGRSANSRNRVFSCDRVTGLVKTEAADPSKMKDPSNIIYNAMKEFRSYGCTTAVVSNGGQTDDATNGMLSGRLLIQSLAGYDYEPDEPHFTPRITAHCSWRFIAVGSFHPTAEIALLRKSRVGRACCDRNLYMYGDLAAGFGHCITTYQSDGDPLPSFEGEPYLLPLRGDAGDVAHTYASELGGPNFIALAVKFIPKSGQSDIVLVNTHAKVCATA